MNSDSHLSDASAPLTNTEDDITGLPVLPTWPRVYWFVLMVFVIYVVLLSALSRAFT